MSALTVQQRRALRYAMTKTEGDREVATQRARHADSSTPTLRHWFEDRGGWFLALLVGFAIFALSACGQFKPGGRPPSTLTLPDSGSRCVRGYETRQTGSVGAYGTPVVEVTDKPCRSRR